MILLSLQNKPGSFPYRHFDGERQEVTKSEIYNGRYMESWLFSLRIIIFWQSWQKMEFSGGLFNKVLLYLCLKIGVKWKKQCLGLFLIMKWNMKISCFFKKRKNGRERDSGLLILFRNIYVKKKPPQKWSLKYIYRCKKIIAFLAVWCLLFSLGSLHLCF